MSHRKKVIKEDPTLFLLLEVALFPTLFVVILVSILATQRKERLIELRQEAFMPALADGG